MEGQILQLDPAKVLADDSIRFGLKDSRIESLAENILQEGGVLEPVGVEELEKPSNGFTHRLVWGFNRHAAVSKLNKEQNAGLTLPAMEIESADAVSRLKTQISENNERENMSPMDRAVAADRLLKAGVERKEVRRIFSSPGGKNGKPQPLSNAMLNIMLRWLEFPKAIQEKIHMGLVGVGAAYELGRVPPDRRKDVLARAEADRLRDIEREEKDEEKYLAAEKKAVEAKEEETAVLSEADKARQAIAAAEELQKAKVEALRELQKEPWLTMDDAGKKVLTEKLKAAEADVKGAEKEVKRTKNDLAKLLNKAKTAAEAAEEAKARLEAARKVVKPKAGAGKKKEVGARDIKAAAQKEGVGGTVPLQLAEIRNAFKDLAEQKDYPRVAIIGQLCRNMVNGGLTPKELIDELALKVTGERGRPAAPAQPPAPPQAAAPPAPPAPAAAAGKAKTGKK